MPPKVRAGGLKCLNVCFKKNVAVTVPGTGPAFTGTYRYPTDKFTKWKSLNCKFLNLLVMKNLCLYMDLGS
jgi:hypothetical protein